MRRALVPRNRPEIWSDPFRNMGRFFDEDFLAPFGSMDHFLQPVSEEDRWLPAVDVREEDDEFVVSADLPGLDKKDVHVEVEDNLLTLSGERKWDDEEKRDRYHRVERSYGKFSRTLRLPTAVDAEKVKAKFTNGILEVSIPKTEEVKPRKIDVH